MIAHFLHGGGEGGGGPVWSNRAQLPHLDLTFPPTPSLILSLSHSLFSYTAHAILTLPQKGLTCPFWVLFWFIYFPWPLSSSLFASLIFVHSCFLSLSFLRLIPQFVRFPNNLHISLFTDYHERGFSQIYGCFHLGSRISDSFVL